jgi:hypothetical protein
VALRVGNPNSIGDIFTLRSPFVTTLSTTHIRMSPRPPTPLAFTRTPAKLLGGRCVSPSWHKMLNGPYVYGDVPGPRSAEMRCGQSCRESNARVYPRPLPMAIGDVGGFVRDVDGSVSVDFFDRAGVLSLGHSHPELLLVSRNSTVFT